MTVDLKYICIYIYIANFQAIECTRKLTLLAIIPSGTSYLMCAPIYIYIHVVTLFITIAVLRRKKKRHTYKDIETSTGLWISNNGGEEEQGHDRKSDKREDNRMERGRYIMKIKVL